MNLGKIASTKVFDVKNNALFGLWGGNIYTLLIKSRTLLALWLETDSQILIMEKKKGIKNKSIGSEILSGRLSLYAVTTKESFQ